MRRIFKSIAASLVGVCLMASPAYAADPLTLKLEPGVAGATSSPQSDRFNLGGSLTVKPLVGLTPYLDVGPSVSYLYLPSNVAGVDAGTGLGLGVSLRLKRPRDESNTDKGFKAASPWIDADAQYVRTGDLNRPGFMVAAGVAVPTSDARNLWIGPFVRYQDIMQGNRVGFDNTDLHAVIAGLSIEIGPKAKKPTPPVKEEEKKVAIVPPPVVEEPEQPPLTFTAHVATDTVIPFKVDSSVLQPVAIELLNKVLASAKNHGDWRLQVGGHASSEGPPEPYNTKLSQRRAQAVVDFLVAHGVPADHLTSKGFGATVPVASNKTAAGRVQNRRVEIELSGDIVIVVKRGGAK